MVKTKLIKDGFLDVISERKKLTFHTFFKEIFLFRKKNTSYPMIVDNTFQRSRERAKNTSTYHISKKVVNRYENM